MGTPLALTTDDTWAQLGVHVSPAAWLDLRIGGGPAWLRASESPFSLGGRVMGQARVRF
jgi:hypothetical protein